MNKVPHPIKIAVIDDLGTNISQTIPGDTSRLVQVFSNLFENSLRYTLSPGTLKVRSSITNSSISLFVEDSAPGVPLESLTKLFDRLYRVERSRSRARGGSGLGLSICKSTVNALGGEIRAANGESGGLRIEVDFPLAG